jgi:PHD/YefM family antitoxin component YafN of YafNO toxin-antitoxin module
MADKEETQFMRPNVFIRVGSTDIDEVEMTAFWEPVIVWLADKFPKWKFVGNYLTQTEASRMKDREEWKWYPRRWTVYLDGEELGTIGMDYYGHKKCYAISNDRIGNKRERGWADKTTKIEQAKKIIMKNFRPKDLKELTTECVNTVRRNVTSNVYASASTYSRLLQRLAQYLAADLESNLDTYMQIARRAGYTEEQEFKEAIETSKIHRSMDKCTQENKGAVVLIHGDTYAVQTDDGQFCTYENATLPDLLKRRVGMLKLVENGETLINVGYRENENRYYVSLEEDNGAS